ncbi:RNA-directed DNA polymerase, eukaryota [Tanacetum coccineum]
MEKDEVLYEVAGEETAAEGSALKNHLDALNSILMDLKNAEVKIDDEDDALILLVLLPPSFKNFMISFVVGKDIITLENVRSSLHSRELRHQASGTSESQPVGLSGHDREECHWKFNCPKLNEKGQVAAVAKDDLGSKRDVIKMHDDVFRTLTDVRHVSDLKKILISLGVFDSNGFKYMSENGVLCVSKGALVVMKETKSTSYLYTLQGETITGSAFVSCSEKVFMMKHKSGVFEKFKHWKILIEDQTGRKIKHLRTDNGLEFCSREFNDFCRDEGIVRHYTVRYTPQQNRTGKPVDYSKLRVFRCPAYYHVSEGKLEPRGEKGIFMGYGDEDYLFYVKQDPIESKLENDVSEKVEDYVAYALQVAKEVESLEPATYREAITSKDSNKWIAAMGEEIESLHKNKTCRSANDFCVYHKRAPSGSLIYLLLYVDDMLVAAKDIDEVNMLKILLNTEFDMKVLGATRKILGTSDVGLIYGGEREYLVAGYSDSDYAVDLDARRSLTCYVFTIGNSVVKSDRKNSPLHSHSGGLNSRVLEESQPTKDQGSPKDNLNQRVGGSILEVIDDMIKVGQAMGFTMEGSLGSKAKKDWIKELNNKHKVNFLSIQETKSDHISDMDIKSLWGNSKFDCTISESVGNSGGILCVWDPSVFCKENHIISDNFIALYGSWVSKKVKLLMISIYAPQSSASKRILWNYISNLIGCWDGHYMVMGDFNEVRCVEDRFGSEFNAQSANEFNCFISNSGLIEIQLEGYSFTWSLQSAKKMSKLDRFLVSDGLLSVFPHLSGICLDRHLSDHRPILLREVIFDYGPSPFRVYHSWLNFQDFDKMVLETWNNIDIDDRNKMVRFKKKLQILKKKIRLWVNDYRKKQSGHLEELRSNLRDIDKELDQGGTNEVILQRRLEILKNLHDINSANARDYMQKAKIQWAIEGDENSKFFHGIINRKRANLAIKGVMVDGDWVDDPCRVKEEFRLHFANRFRAPVDTRYKLNYTFPNKLQPDQMATLESLVSRDEVRNAVWGCGENKSSGPDGFSFEFFRKFWDTILDDPFIINELLFWCKHKKQQAMVFKVDFAKAYDSIRWDFLEDVLTAFGFGPKWCSWIRGCLHSGMASVLLNGSPSSEFQFYCGLKQGDPLAPYLFLLVMESLHLSVSRAIEAGIFKGIKIDSTLNLSHLFYADDVVFIGEWSPSNLSGITNILHCFSLLSGLSINLKKSNLLGVGVRSEYVKDAAVNLGCLTMKTPFKYLGVMVGGICATSQAWEDTIGKLKARLSNWKLKTLSVGGRLTLLKSVLGSTPIYNLSIYKAPKSVLHSMESLRRNFFNGSQCNERKIAWIKWTTTLASKKNGGLGISSLYALNRALLFKWVWRFISRDNSLWCRLILSMHGSKLPSSSPFRYSTWLSIIREIHSLKDRGVDLVSHCRIHVGNGLRTNFWKEVWIGDNPLCVLFPRIFALETNKDSSVAVKLSSVTSSLRRPVRGGSESSQLSLLQEYIEGTILSSLEDRWVWDLNGEGVFCVKDVRNLLDDVFLPKAPIATRWIKYVPIKLNVFAWKVHLNRLPTRVNLQHRGVLVSDPSCPICHSEDEDLAHLFFRCSLVTDIVRLVCRWWNIAWASIDSYSNWLHWFNAIRLSPKVNDLLEGVFYITWWSIWRFRNQVLFSSLVPRKDVLFDEIVSRSFTWCRSRCKSNFSWVSWLQHPYLISL